MALLGAAGCELKFGVADARVAAASGGAGKAKKDRVENILTAGLRSTYGEMKAALAQAGGVQEAELYANEATLARSVTALCTRLYEALPTDAPTFPEHPAMLCRLLFAVLLDEANLLKQGAAEAFWVPAVCEGALGSRGSAPVRFLPGVHLVIAPFNPKQPFAEAVRQAGESLLTPRPSQLDAATGTRIRPPIELITEDDGTVVWDARV